MGALEGEERVVTNVAGRRDDGDIWKRHRDIDRRVTALERKPAPSGGSHTHDGTGTRSVVVGGVNEADPGKAIASATNSTAVGDYSQALGRDSVAIGGGDHQGTGTIDIDAAAYASSDGANVAIGNACALSGAVAIGDGAGGLGENSVALGIDAAAGVTLSTDSPIAIGKGAFSGHNRSIALGDNASTSAAEQVHIGSRHIEMRVAFTGVPGTPADKYLRLYTKEVSGETRLFYKSDAGTEYGPL